MRAFQIELPRFRRVLGAILLAHFLAILAMAASPTLHERMHADSHAGDHDCAVVLFTGGGVEAAAVVVILIVALAVQSGSPPVPAGEHVERIFRVLRILEHAPPARG